MGAYLFVHFVGRENTEDCEQIYFSVSKDGFDWVTINNKQPVLRSNLGEKGARDPFIIKSHDGKRYYLIASDLSIYHRGANAWRDCQTHGSRSILVWESEDLISWSGERLVSVAADGTGCAWAPEAMYDGEKGKYIVYWASTSEHDDYKHQRMYYAYTSDFKEFTPAQIYMDDASDEAIKDGTAASNIDSTIAKSAGYYYRFTKNESQKTIIMDRSAHLSRGWERMDSPSLSLLLGYEGPAVFKMHNGGWGLFLDHFAEQKGYELFTSENIAMGVFEKSKDCTFDDLYRHGTVIAISDEEYERLVSAY